jgi:putative transposase
VAKKRTPSFVTELEIIADSFVRKEFNAKFNAGFRLMNAVQGEMVRRKDILIVSAEWSHAKSLPRMVRGEDGRSKLNPERRDAFQDAKNKALFTKVDAEHYSKWIANSSGWIADKLDSVIIQTIAERAFNAVNKITYGKARKVRFKNNQCFSSMQGKQISTSIRVVQDKKTEAYQFAWGKLRCPLMIDWGDPCVVHGMNSPWKYGRLVRRAIRGVERFFIQLICEGFPYSERENTQVKNDVCSIDLNVSNVAMVSRDTAFLKPFAPNAPKIESRIKAIQRKQERSRRINNPKNYSPDHVTFKGKHKGRKVKRKGMIKRGIRLQWKNTASYNKLGQVRRRLERSKSEYVKSENRRLVNDVLRLGGKHIKLEKVSVKGWQKRYGKAIAAKSPGFFQSELVRKAESAGGTAHRYSTRTTACSQTHLNGERHKKTLSERIHRDITGPMMHRDLFSAYLGLYVNQDSLLMVDTAQADYPRVEPTLQAAWQAFVQSTSNPARLGSRSPESPSESICAEGQKLHQIGYKADKCSVNGHIQLCLCLT